MEPIHEDEKTALESLNEQLNDPDQKGIDGDISPKIRSMDGVLPVQNQIVKTVWGERKEKVFEKAERITNMKKKNIFLKRFLLGAVVFFLISVAFAAYVIIGGVNQVSSENIILTLEGANNTPAGKMYDFSLKLENNNNVTLEQSILKVEFPEGTRSSQNPILDLRRERVDTGSIGSREIIEQEFSAIFYGDKGESKKIIVSFEYSVPGSNSAFTKTQEFEIEIDSSPIIVEFDMKSEFVSGQEFEAEILISSNTDDTIRDVILVAEYPFGFDFISSIPNARFENNVWFLGNIKPTEKKIIVLKGKVDGTTNDERTIRFNLGISNSENSNELGSLITQKVHTYSIKKPLLELVGDINGKLSNELAFNMGEQITVSLDVTNNLDTEVENAVVEIEIPLSVIIDDSQISVSNGGFYRSSDRKVVWDRNSNPDLITILPGESIPLFLTLRTISPSSRDTLSQRNPNFSIKGSVRGSADSEIVESSINKLIRINSQISIHANSAYSGTAIANTGPLPPKTNNETTYTITLSFSNRYNTLSGARVVANLPSFVDWKGVISPSNESVTYNPNTRDVVWNIGRLQAGVGQSSSPKQVSFKIGLIPSTSQIGSTPVLLENVRASAVDDFTNTDLFDSSLHVTTLIQNDPIFIEGIDKVVQ